MLPAHWVAGPLAKAPDLDVGRAPLPNAPGCIQRLDARQCGADHAEAAPAADRTLVSAPN